MSVGVDAAREPRAARTAYRIDSLLVNARAEAVGSRPQYPPWLQSEPPLAAESIVRTRVSFDPRTRVQWPPDRPRAKRRLSLEPVETLALSDSLVRGRAPLLAQRRKLTPPDVDVLSEHRHEHHLGRSTRAAAANSTGDLALFRAPRKPRQYRPAVRILNRPTAQPPRVVASK